MPTKLIEYRGYIVSASYYEGAAGRVPTVQLRKDGSSVRLPPPSTECGLKTEDEAFAAGIEYAKSAIDVAINASN